MKKWEDTHNGNEILKGKGFYISYNKDTNSNPNALGYGFMAQMLTGNSDFIKTAEETALVKEGNNVKYRFLILNGDFRKQYEKLIDKGYRECKRFYESKKKEKQSIWSSDFEEKE